MSHPLPSMPLFASWRDQLPGWFNEHGALGIPFSDWLGLFALALTAIVVGIVGQGLVLRIARGVANRTSSRWDNRVVELLPGLAAIVIGLLTFGLTVPLLAPAPETAAGVEILVRTLMIVAVTALVFKLTTVAGEMLEEYLTRDAVDENRRRTVQTQVRVPRGILRVVVVIIGAALILLQFDVVRSVGISLLASAGLAGIVIGLAAQKTVGNILAGIQLAVFQPVRIGDAVVVQGEWGWIEEIGMTHVVVKIWDLRRLVLPVGYFLDQPFQNWTRGASDLLGTILVYADYTVPVESIRAELASILRDTPLWDGRAQGVQVTNLTAESVEVRVLVSAADGGRLWDLRCLVREKLLTWLQSQARDHLPVNRVELLNGTDKASSVVRG